MIHYVLPLLNLLVNSVLLYKVFRLLSVNFYFEYFVLFLFILFFVFVAGNALFKNVLSFMTKKRTFNLLFIVQFLASILIMQLLGWIFTVYLSFVFMLIYLLLTKQNKEYNFFLQLCGIVVGGVYLYIGFF